MRQCILSITLNNVIRYQSKKEMYCVSSNKFHFNTLGVLRFFTKQVQQSLAVIG